MEYLVNEMRGNQLYPGNCIYIPENYPEDWWERLEAGEIVSYEEDGEQCKIWLDNRRDRREIKQGCTALDPDPEYIKTFDDQNARQASASLKITI